ncbi:hypothetical protein PQ455_07495 [Sphingomonas naphthae]|uniref:Uncharacterized protein n=1 Tax=Sphingomonas naphthae TaxID=1813468 RepID=A0ABY7TP98_9SPHN|nr:hypothetical protein [Sphingomonas naphthae]WCT75050.1 hypothetical protein PQ455_07495 [Sphingomonas naphthae]
MIGRLLLGWAIGEALAEVSAALARRRARKAAAIESGRGVEAPATNDGVRPKESPRP